MLNPALESCIVVIHWEVKYPRNLSSFSCLSWLHPNWIFKRISVGTRYLKPQLKVPAVSPPLIFLGQAADFPWTKPSKYTGRRQSCVCAAPPTGQICSKSQLCWRSGQLAGPRELVLRPGKVLPALSHTAAMVFFHSFTNPRETFLFSWTEKVRLLISVG